MHRRTFVQAASTLPLAAVLNATSAQELIQNLKLLVGYAPGGATDAASRLVAEKVQGLYAQTVIVENRTGAGGMIAAKAACIAPPDGATAVITPSGVLSLFPHVFAKMLFDPLADLAPVSNVYDYIYGLVVGPSVPESVKTVGNFVEWCRQNPASANCATPGEGSAPQFLIYLLSRASGVNIQPVAYKGSAAAVLEVAGGQIAAMVMPPDGTYLQYQRTGKLRLLATSGAERWPFFPEVPTFSEAGYPSLTLKDWCAMFMPAGTPPATVERASAAVRVALTQKDVADRFSGLGVVAAPSKPAELAQSLKAAYASWQTIVKSSGFKLL